MKKMDKLKKHAITNKKLLTFLITLLIIGILAGTFFLILLKTQDKNMIKEYLTSFLEKTKQNNFNYKDVFINTLGSNLFTVISIWVLGLSVIGLPVLLFFYFSKSFLLGFTIASIAFKFKFKGILFTLVYIFPHQIINIFIYTLLTMYSIKISLTITKTLTSKKSLNLRPIMKKYLYILLLSIVGVLISSTLEVFLMPILIKGILPIL